ncbi:MAG: hypothetical protein ACKV2Q_00675 [Planctomycetaceae bacterium]
MSKAQVARSGIDWYEPVKVTKQDRKIFERVGDWKRRQRDLEPVHPF